MLGVGHADLSSLSGESGKVSDLVCHGSVTGLLLLSWFAKP